MASPSIYRQTILPGGPSPNYVNVTKTQQAILPGIYLNATVPKMQVAVMIVVA